ncbi:hypothetical protein T440DRAFT_517242 [Plenodomus tracheiphilus IPT5]|uniref:Uncharacterized protein n=1 Tax=Plenodomus tracheiphilus IPT5 TaxID=1408161 RepID=A0A6A7B8P8_9PLEO|nr:hypothetical protein T440DRAFT_517242 [Plenodomus tracheiphilus IPT5]
MQPNTNDTPSEPRQILVHEGTQNFQLYQDLICMAREPLQHHRTSLSADAPVLVSTNGAAQKHGQRSSQNSRLEPTGSAPSQEADIHEQSFVVASVQALGSLDHWLILTDEDAESEGEEVPGRSTYARYDSLVLRRVHHGAYCHIKTAFRKLFKFGKRSKAKKHSTITNTTGGGSKHIGAFTLYQGGDDDEASSPVPGPGNGQFPQEMLPYSAFNKHCSLPPVPLEDGETNLSQTRLGSPNRLLMDQATDPPQSACSSRRSSLTRNLHTALLYTAHSRTSSSESPVDSDHHYHVVEPPGQDDFSTPEDNYVSDDDINWIGQYINISSASPTTQHVRTMRGLERTESPKVVEEDASAAWATISRASPTTVSIRRSVSVRSSWALRR